ncbi:MAG: hypothetical protein ACRYGI_10340 [Janthinobacterium lividum]
MTDEHMEQNINHTDGQQDTGNHKKPDAPDAKGADRFGGTRAGAENLEPTGKTSIQKGTDVEQVQALDESPAPDLTNQHGEHAERAPERDERGRL